MRNLKWRTAIALVALVVAAAAAEAQAALVYNLGVVLEGSSNPDASGPWLKAEFTDKGDSVELTITNLMETTSEFVSDFAFNVVGYDPSSLTITQSGAISTTNPAVASISKGQNSQNLPGVKGFDVLLSWPTTNKNSGALRFNFPDVVTFVISRAGTNLSESDFNGLNNPANASPLSHVGAHIQGIPSGSGTSSVTIGYAVPPPPKDDPPQDIPPPAQAPEPSTLLMGGLASLVGLGLAKFRRSKSS